MNRVQYIINLKGLSRQFEFGYMYVVWLDRVKLGEEPEMVFEFSVPSLVAIRCFEGSVKKMPYYYMPRHFGNCI
jgi:hypothetical protein